MLPVPTRIGRYEIKGRIGGGGMGTLYLARDTNPTTDRLVAVKLLRASFDSDDLRQRFAREAQALAELNHPNIVIIHDSGEYQDSPFIVMEYIRGETLAESIRRRASMSLATKLRLLAELCAGLSHAHEAGIIHRDIKPANLMVDLHGRLKVLDFGIARVVDPGMTRIEALTRLNVQIGTPGYMSPEQIEGGEIDARSDLFSAGAVAYELISYHEAFPGATTRQIENRVLGEQPLPLASAIPGLDPEIADIIGTALEKDVNRRCQHAATLGRAFDRVRARLEEEERLPRPTPAPKAGERKSRHERAAQAAYERALTSYREGADGFARRSAMEALAEYPQHADARQLLGALGYLRDVEPWLSPSAAGATPAGATPAGATAAGATPAGGMAVGDLSPTGAARSRVTAAPTVAPLPTVAPQPIATVEPTASPSAVATSPAVDAAASTAIWQEPPGAPAAERTQLWQAPGTTVPQPAPAADVAPTLVAPPPAVTVQGPVQTKPDAKPAVPPKAQQPRVERKPAERQKARAVVRVALIIVGLVIAGIAGGMVAQWLWPPGGPVEQLTISKPEGGTLLGDGIDCGTQAANCSVARPRGAAVTLQARADAGFVFSAFTGDCAADGSVVMAAARTCGATFSRITVPPAAAGGQLLTVDMPTGGTIEGAGIRCGSLGSDCSAKQAADAQVILVATPDSGFTLGAFTGDCAPAGVTTMSAARRCGATFVPAPPQWALTITKPIGGTIVGPGIRCGTAGSACASRQPQGLAVTLKYQAEKGYTFVAFTGDCSPSGKTVMNAARNCSATFVKEAAASAPPAPVLTITRPQNGTILGNGINCGTGGSECSAAQANGASVTLRVQPDAGYRFAAFTGDCDAAGLVIMTAPRTCGATFAAVAVAPPPAGREMTTNLPKTRAFVVRTDDSVTITFLGDSEFGGYSGVLKRRGGEFEGSVTRQGCASPSRITRLQFANGVATGRFELQTCDGRPASRVGISLSEKR